MDSYKELLPELKEGYYKCKELVDIAHFLNRDENTRTAFSQKVTDYISDVMQTIGFLIGEFEDL